MADNVDLVLANADSAKSGICEKWQRQIVSWIIRKMLEA